MAPLVVAVLLAVVVQDPEITWKALLSITGDWVGEGSGKPGEGTGEFSLAPQLDGAILVRHSRSDYPAANGKPAAHHSDLMVYYRRGSEVRADYWDSEGNTINYGVEASADGNRITLVSEPAADAPRFRFTYGKLSPDRMEVIFETAPPGKPDQFAIYVKGTVHRK